MKNTFLILGFILLSDSIILSNTAGEIYIQTSHTKKYVYQYSFEQAESEEKVKAAESTLKNLLHVKEVKCQYKPDTKRGVFTIVVVEELVKSESQELFSPKMIKETLLQNGLQPIDFTVTEETI